MTIALAVLGLLLAGAAPPDKDLPVTGQAGWSGRVSRGEWAPVFVDLENRGKKDVELLVSVVWAAAQVNQPRESPSFGELAGRSGPVHSFPVTLPPKSRKRLSLCIRTPDAPGLSVWAFALTAGGGSTISAAEFPVRAVEPHRRLVGIVGSIRPEGLEAGSTDVGRLLAEDLPDEWQGYAALEALVWLDGRPGDLRSNAQVEALRTWISAGGRLYVARSTTAGLTGTPIADLLPVKLGVSRELATLGGGYLPDAPAAVLETTVRHGSVRNRTDGVPLVVDGPRDAGQVSFVAFDPTRPPFTAWSGLPAFWRWLLQLPEERAQLPPLVELPPGAIGSAALAAQIGRFPDVAAPEIGGLFLLIILYLVAVGPLDYLLLRWLRKLEYTWFTFPGYVVLFTIFILVVGGGFIQRPAHQREVAVVDHFEESTFVRRRALSTVLSPANVMYQLDDAEPLSSNFTTHERLNDDQSKVTDVRILRHPGRRTENWLLNRNFTGLAMVDRCGSEPSTLSWKMSFDDKLRIRVSVKNSGSETWSGCSLATPNGVYELAPIVPGDSEIDGTRSFPTIRAYADSGAPAGPAEAPDMNPSEKSLNPVLRRALIQSCFGADPADQPATGFARSIQARRWIADGGSILLVWPPSTEPLVRFEPKTSRVTSVTLHRYFQGPP